MGYEPLIPPIPDRVAEQRYIEELEKNFKSQPFHKHYSPESFRTNKMELGDRVTEYNKAWTSNFLIGNLDLTRHTSQWFHCSSSCDYCL